MTFDELFERDYARLVRGLSGRFNAEDAADAVQEAFVVADQRWDYVVTMEQPAGWIRRVAINYLMAERALWARRREILATVVQTPRENLQDEMLDFRRALERLSDRQRIAVCLADLDGWTVDEIAGVLGCGRRMVNKYLWAARQQLRTAMGGAAMGDVRSTVPGSVIRQALVERQMSLNDFAAEMRRPASRLSEIINGKRRITPKTAQQLERVLGIPAQRWLELERSYSGRVGVDRYDGRPRVTPPSRPKQQLPPGVRATGPNYRPGTPVASDLIER